MDFDLSAGKRVILKERKKMNTYLELVREQEKLWNIKVTVIPTVVGVLETSTRTFKRH